MTAATFVVAIDEASRFRRAHEVGAYLGLVPRELSSGATQRRGRITKAGSSRVRWLLIQAAVSMLRLRDPRTATLREWAGRIAALSSFFALLFSRSCEGEGLSSFSFGPPGLEPDHICFRLAILVGTAAR